jgi:transposase
MQPLNTGQMIITDARHMPIVNAYAKKISLIDNIDRMVDVQMELSPGMAVFGMVLDTLSGRTPLYRLTGFFEEKDTELLSLYKSQIGIEKNFSFLKDPAIINSIFLKKAERIEVLVLVFMISLLIWRLMERSMRRHVETNDCTLPGWVRRQTKKPTTFMMTTKFTAVMVIPIGRHRQLAKPLKPFQQEYLTALGVTADAFTVP